MEERKMEVKKIEAGTILESSWGYDQTNVDFYVVVKGGQVGQMVQLKKIQKSYKATGDMTGTSVPYVVEGLPQSDAGSKVFTKKLKLGYQGDFMVKIESYAFATVWDGKPCSESSYA
jgi:hypothetical protein